MADVQFHNPSSTKKKSFWQRPEGVTGAVVLAGLLIGGGYLVSTLLPFMLAGVGLMVTLGVLAAVIYMVLDPRMRNLVWYMYKSVMRSITGMFIQMDPIGILKSYISDLEDNFRKLSKQIGALKGQKRQLKSIMDKNTADIQSSMRLASKARETQKQQQMILHSRKAARLKESNSKYSSLYKRIDVMERILKKMHQNSEIMIIDMKDQVAVKEQERKAIRASHSAMKSARSVISGDPDKRAMFDQALESITEDVANKVGEMERFMEQSANFMDSIDLQNGVFEEQGLQMLEKWEKESSMILMDEKTSSLLDSGLDSNTLDLNQKVARPEKQTRSDNNYDTFFE